MNNAKITIELESEVPDGANLDEVYDIVTKALYDAGIGNWFWKKTEVFDSEGKFLDGEYC